MGDYYHNTHSEKETILDEIWEQILVISKGECHITDEMILSVENNKHRFILGGLQMLHEDLEAYKQDFAKKLEAEYQVEVLKKKNEELAQFNYVASHDLQEPLRTIISFSDMLKENYIDKLDEEGKLPSNPLKDWTQI